MTEKPLPPRTLGAFSLPLLASIRRLGGEAWGSNIRSDLSSTLGREIAVGQLYLTLSRLAGQGLVSSTTTPCRHVRGGRAKKLYRLEELGARALATIDRH